MRRSPQAGETLRFFSYLASRPENEIKLFEAALCLAAIHEPKRPPGWMRPSLEAFDSFAETIRWELSSHPGEFSNLRTLVRVFGNRLGFSGEVEDYENPHNSCLDEVIRQRRGLPISLSVLLICLGNSVGIPVIGINSPAHFLAAADIEGIRYYIDPFHGSPLMEEMEARNHLAQVIGRPLAMEASSLQPAGPKLILKRMINNLKSSYSKEGNPDKLLRAVEWAIVLDPGDLFEQRNRGLLRLRTGDFPGGAEDLKRYLEGHPHPEDTSFIHEELQRAVIIRSIMN